MRGHGDGIGSGVSLLPRIERLVQHLRHAGRALRRDPGFTTTAILVLALGIGGTTTVFSLANARLDRRRAARNLSRTH